MSGQYQDYGLDLRQSSDILSTSRKITQNFNTLLFLILMLNCDALEQKLRRLIIFMILYVNIF